MPPVKTGAAPDSLRFWLDVEWDPKSASHSCISVNGMMIGLL